MVNGTRLAGSPIVAVHSKPSVVLPPKRMIPGLSAFRASATSRRQPKTVSAGISDTWSIHSVPGPRKEIVSVAWVSVAEGVSIGLVSLPLLGRAELGRGVGLALAPQWPRAPAPSGPRPAGTANIAAARPP